MSLIRLRQEVQREGKRTAIVFVVLSLALLAAHHAGLHASHQPSAPTHHAVAGDEMPNDMSGPAAPGSGADAVVAICLAVLPALLLAALAVAGALALRCWWRVPTVVGRLLCVPLPASRAAPARDGPRELCVIRC